MDAVLGVDVGSKRIGVAVATAGVATPLTVLERSAVAGSSPGADGDAEAARRVAELARERGATLAVVGLPLSMSGARGPAVEAAERFADALRAAGLDVVMQDERLTTAETERTLIAGGARRDRRKRVIDKLAATVILQAWLDAGGPGGPEVPRGAEPPRDP